MSFYFMCYRGILFINDFIGEKEIGVVFDVETEDEFFRVGYFNFICIE